MRSRFFILVVLVAVLAPAYAQAAATRARKPYKKLPMLGERSCEGLLNAHSFANAISEHKTVAGRVGASYSSDCAYLPPENESSQREIGGGAVTLAVYDRVSYEFRGKERNLASFVPSPEGYFRSARRAGEHSYAGFKLSTGGEPDLVWGVVQVRNDVATIAAEFPASPSDGSSFDLSWIDERLKVVAYELCPRCK